MRLARSSLLALLTAVHNHHRHRAFASSLPPTNQSINPQSLYGIQQFLPYSTNMSRLAPVVCVSHGGGPMPVLGEPSQAAIAKSLRTRVPKILKLGTPEQPRAIILVTAHWSTDVVSISSAARHELLYDYYGFPPESYELKYDAPGSPEIASLIEEKLKEAGILCKKNARRGWDHGVFIPLILIHPAATIPIIQLSVLASESPSAHYAIGRALAPLRAQNIAIIGSGFASMHNLGAMFSSTIRSQKYKALNEAWSRRVTEAAETADVEARAKAFEGWREWEGAWDMHPRGGAEHFLPLIVCAGAAGEESAKSYSDEMMGLEMWSYYWDDGEGIQLDEKKGCTTL